MTVDYADIFQESEDAESLNLSSLDLSEWNVALLSTNENVVKKVQPKPKPIKVKSKVKGSYKVSSTLISTPVRVNKRKSRANVLLTPSAKVVQQQNIIIGNIQECTQRVSNFENVVARIDKALVESDAKLSALGDTLFQSLDDLANRVKKEMSLLRKAFDEKILQYDERANKAESEVRKLQGRLGSLVEEKNQLSKKIRSLEGSNKSLLDQVEALQNNIKDVAVQRDLESGVHDDCNVNITGRVRDESQNLRTDFKTVVPYCPKKFILQEMVIAMRKGRKTKKQK